MGNENGSRYSMHISILLESMQKHNLFGANDLITQHVVFMGSALIFTKKRESYAVKQDVDSCGTSILLRSFYESVKEQAPIGGNFIFSFWMALYTDNPLVLGTFKPLYNPIVYSICGSE